MANYYEILQVPIDASIERIKAAFRRLARQYHPDVNPSDPSAGEKFREIERAYEVLRDPVLRQQYDRENNFRAGEISGVGATGHYERGLRYEREGNYPKAIEEYSRAIALDPGFWRAYIQRASANYRNYQDRAVLEDCRLALQENPNCGEAHYYLGLARQRLGYTQSAIDAYTKAISLDPNPARVYYQRGLAREELGEYGETLRDWRLALEEYQKVGDVSRYRFTRGKIKALEKTVGRSKRKDLISLVQLLPAMFLGVFRTFLSSLVNPRGGLTGAFVRSGNEKALGTGVLAGALGAVCLAWSWRDGAIEYLWLLGTLPFLFVTLSSYFLRSIGKIYGHIAGDVFLAGFSLLPISLGLALTATVPMNEDAIGFIIGAASVYSAWIAYNAATGLVNIPARLAIFFIPSMMLTVGMTIAIVYYRF
jgi:curved DNA-binding protein CbpA